MTANGSGPAMLAIAKPPDGHRIGGVAGQVVAAKALDGDDPPGPQVREGGLERRFAACRRGGISRPPVTQLRTAVRARHRLGVESPVRRVPVFALAGRAKPELAHAGPGPVVGQVIDDRGPRAAVGAVRERIPIPPILRVEELIQTVVAGGDVGREQPIGRDGRLALLDSETRTGGELMLRGPDLDLLHPGARRRVRSKPEYEQIDRLLRAGDLDLHLTGPIDDASVEPELGREPPYERSEADALDDARDLDRAGNPLAGGPGLHVTAALNSISICSVATSGTVSAPQLGQRSATPGAVNSTPQLGQR